MNFMFTFIFKSCSKLVNRCHVDCLKLTVLSSEQILEELEAKPVPSKALDYSMPHQMLGPSAGPKV
jgi:hypothetical protein